MFERAVHIAILKKNVTVTVLRLGAGGISVNCGLPERCGICVQAALTPRHHAQAQQERATQHGSQRQVSLPERIQPADDPGRHDRDDAQAAEILPMIGHERKNGEVGHNDQDQQRGGDEKMEQRDEQAFSHAPAPPPQGGERAAAAAG